jgi:hypothetical protein
LKLNVFLAFPRPGLEGKQEEMQVARAIKQAVDEDQLENAMREEDMLTTAVLVLY